MAELITYTNVEICQAEQVVLRNVNRAEWRDDLPARQSR